MGLRRRICNDRNTIPFISAIQSPHYTQKNTLVHSVVMSGWTIPLVDKLENRSTHDKS